MIHFAWWPRSFCSVCSMLYDTTYYKYYIYTDTPMPITTEQVHHAADQLATAGHRPTLAAVREVLGGGSYTTINQALQAWRTANAETLNALRTKPTAPVTHSSPATLQQHVEALTTLLLWMTALHLAQRSPTSPAVTDTPALETSSLPQSYVDYVEVKI